MTTITKKELIDQISEKSGYKRVVVKKVIQTFLDDVIDELGRDNRLEFRDFGVFETKCRASRVAQNPKTLERVEVPAKRTVKFKVGRLMKLRLQERDQLDSLAKENAPGVTDSPVGDVAQG
ncbi:MAG: integration host factor subunit beta [Phycisphaerae bacterium]|nr:integration host factor subunit beta [Phycisphaerae bacterium]